ncbi:MAG: hypothetical protein AB7N76_34690 [Planctomycetota bacterium]
MGRTLAGTILLTLALVGHATAQPEENGENGGRWRNGGTQLMRHHLMGEELRAASGGDDLPTGKVDQEQTPAQTLKGALANETAQDLLGDYMAGRVPVAFAALSEADQARFAALLHDHAGNPTAQAYLLRGLASSNSVDDMSWFSGEIKGRDAAWLRNNATLTGDDPLTQQYSASCVPTVSQALRGELDPVYALRTRQGGDVHSYDGTDPEAYNPGAAQEQRTLLEGGGGVPVARDMPNGAGLQMDPFQDVMTQAGQGSGLSYEWAATPNGEDAAAILDANLGRGIPTPLRIEGGYVGHAVLGVDSRVDAAGATEYQIYDPWFGTLTWVPRDAVVNDQVDVGTHQPEVTHAFRATY